MNSPNMILDLRIPQNQKYQQVVLDEAILPVPRRRDRQGCNRPGCPGRLERAERGDRHGRTAGVLQGYDRRQLIATSGHGASSAVTC
jgi:hypothetical protein